MNYEDIKEQAILKKWGNLPRYDNDYRNLSKQIDNFIVHLKKEDSPLNWLPLHLLSSEEIADFICTYLDRSQENRLLLEHLNHKGIKYDYSDLIVTDPKRTESLKGFLEKEMGFENYVPYNILELKQDVSLALAGSRYEGYKKTLNYFLYIIDTIRGKILDEKNLFKCLGLGFLNMGYIEQFITICERMCYGSLFYCLVDNNNVTDKMASLLQFEKMLSKAEDTINEETLKSKKAYQSSREFKEQNNIKPREMDEISLYFVQYLERKSYYDELDNIATLMVAGAEEEINNPKSQKFEYDEKITDFSDSKLQSFLTEDKSVPNYKQKLQDVINVMKFARVKENFWASCDSSKELKIAFQEIVVHNDKYNLVRQKTLTMIRNMLSYDDITREQLMFLDMKMTRGYFRENNMLEEYLVYTRICKKLRRMFLHCYSAINDVEAYKLIHRTCFEFMYLFADSKYSGITIE